VLSSQRAHLKCVWTKWSNGLSLQFNFAACGPETSPVLYYPGMLERKKKTQSPHASQANNNLARLKWLKATCRLGSSLQAASQIPLWSVELFCRFQFPTWKTPPTVTKRLLQKQPEDLKSCATAKTRLHFSHVVI